MVASSKQAKCPHGINAAVFIGLTKHTGHSGITTSSLFPPDELDVTSGGGGNDGGNDDISMVYDFTPEYKGSKSNKCSLFCILKCSL